MSRARYALLGAAAAWLALPVAAAQILDEVPFVVTPDNVTAAMLKLARVGPKDFVVDLGSGDGRIVILAAKRFGARGLGVDLVADLVRQSRESARRAGVEDRVEFRVQDLFETDLSKASVVTMYLLPDVNIALRSKLLALDPGTRVVSHDWDMGEWKPDRTVVLEVPDKPVGLEKKSRIHLWIVPARVDGHWCGTGAAEGVHLHVQQKYQRFYGKVTAAGAPPSFRGTIDGAVLMASRGKAAALELKLGDGRLEVAAARGAYAAWAGAAFEPRAGEGCP